MDADTRPGFVCSELLRLAPAEHCVSTAVLLAGQAWGQEQGSCFLVAENKPSPPGDEE